MAQYAKGIEELYKTCLICQKEGGAKYNTKKNIQANKKNEMWQVDLIARFEREGKSEFIVIAVDYYSKLVETKIIKEKQQTRSF